MCDGEFVHNTMFATGVYDGLCVSLSLCVHVCNLRQREDVALTSEKHAYGDTISIT